MLIKSDWSAESTILGRAEQSNSLSGEEERNLWLLEIIILLFLINLRSLPFECIAICVASTQSSNGTNTSCVCARDYSSRKRRRESSDNLRCNLQDGRSPRRGNRILCWNSVNVKWINLTEFNQTNKRNRQKKSRKKYFQFPLLCINNSPRLLTHLTIYNRLPSAIPPHSLFPALPCVREH